MAATEPLRSASRIPALDGLRGTAILLVLLWHGLFSFNLRSEQLQRALSRIGGLSWSGVDLFFVLSGFLIGGILLDARSSPRYFQTFYIRRAFRILPVYFALLIAYSVWHVAHRSAGEVSPFEIPLAAYFSFLQNCWMAYLGRFGTVMLMVTWSLAIEEQFYLTIPLLIRRLALPLLTVVLAGIVVAAPLLRTALLLWSAHGQFADYVLMPCRADALSLGVLAAIVVRSRHWESIQRRRAWLWAAAGVSLAPLIYLSVCQYQWHSPPMVTVGYSLLALFYALMLLLALASAGFARVLAIRPLTALGDLAYGTYLLHLPVIEICRRALEKHPIATIVPGSLLSAWIGIVVAIFVASLSWHYFEKPLLKLGHAYRY